ncbi:hypothetical protein GCM10025872_09490 [Barrientosiimonas endolithica]|uniref:Alpha-1,4-glucan:maltose-1-phosphate maltosyltransferase domain-containing protein n=1 Tax=Barrientosiimonas endolithica TaxID=1535208 RepID=A0ABM8H9B8_9MICO|nr:hypothetical protein GCM10025872_09490 [Barrientosiimonas endolithica]
MTEQQQRSYRLPATTATTRSGAPEPRPIGRIPVQDVRPAVDGGALPTKSVVAEPLEVSATVFREGTTRSTPASS